MRPHAATGSRVAYGEDAVAAIRALFGLTGAVGGLLAVMGLAVGDVPFIAVPTLALLGSLLTRAPIEWAGWAALAVWMLLLPSTPGEALIAPLAMIVTCLAIVLGPDRMAAWISRDATASPRSNPTPDGWIEEEPRRIG
jgi:hypothetical protein